MNPIFRYASEANDLGLLMGFTTVLFVVTFVGWTWWVFRPSNRENMETWSRLPLEDDTPGGAR